MTSITQTIEITEDHKLQLNLQLPGELPQGAARIVLTVLPAENAAPIPGANSIMAMYGKGKGKVRMSDDFDAPLDDFKDYQ